MLPGAGGDEAVAVDGRLDRHARLALTRPRVPDVAHDRVDLALEGVEAGGAADLEEERELVVGGAFGHRLFDQVDLVARELAGEAGAVVGLCEGARLDALERGARHRRYRMLRKADASPR